MQWVPDLRSFFEPRRMMVPILLVGCKADRRTAPGASTPPRSCLVPAAEAERTAAQLGLSGYIECTAKNATRTAVFQTLARMMLTGSSDASVSCVNTLWR